ncbi:stress protein [Devosia limi DSM 17137]|uniref:Stress protein n=1 Tax=Devosia limi DSM 17137 TaxID=1121477 RepID=A0A0F5LQR1_9HYPH|nr:TerD family protein [Devosia limi]KKB84668.1 stress protein [Devosia limi DSM 17137]SHF54999.1 tellurium resistance protein TerD [Devosia limi DSM 17137]
MLTLSLEKPGVQAPKLKLSLNKGAQFTARIEWQCNANHRDDVDVHALEARNDGNGAKVTELASVLSTYNTKLMNPSGGALPSDRDGSFQTPSGGLSHSGDKRVQNNTETIVIDGSKLPVGVNEIPILVTVHEAEHGAGHEAGEEEEDEAAFGDIDVCTITLLDDTGKELGAYRLSEEFKEFNVVQFGSLLLGDNGWEYAAVGSGFNGDFNDVLTHFS